MKKIFTFLISGLLATASVMQAQDIDESYVFVDEDGNVIENGATVVRNEMGVYLDGRDVIRSGISVYNQSGNTAVDYLKVYYDIERIDNGSYQICFPSTCNEQSMVGSYETGRGQLMGNLQDIQSEWFTQGEGECIVTLTIEILDRDTQRAAEIHLTKYLDYIKKGSAFDPYAYLDTVTISGRSYRAVPGEGNFNNADIGRDEEIVVGSDMIEVNGDVDTALPGTYRVEYSITIDRGHTDVSTSHTVLYVVVR